MIADSRDSFCALSGLPISEGDPVLALPLAHIHHEHGVYCAPLCTPALGAYDTSRAAASELDSTSSGSLCARVLGFSSVSELIHAAGHAHIKEPERPASASGQHASRWFGTGVALMHPQAWSALMELPMQVGADGFEPSTHSGGVRSYLTLASLEAVGWVRAARAAIERATGRPATDFPSAEHLLARDERLFQDFAAQAVYMSQDLPDCKHFDAIFGRRAKAGLVFTWHALESRTERLAMLTLPRMAFSDEQVESAVFELSSLAAANHAWRSMLGRRWAPSPAAPQGRASRGIQWLWADQMRSLSMNSVQNQGPGDPHSALAHHLMERAELEGDAANSPRLRPPSL